MTDIFGTIPTRGDVDMSPCVDSMRRAGIRGYIWNNQNSIDFKVFARYLPMVGDGWCYTQDDDVIVSDILALTAYRVPGKIICNMPAEFQEAYRDKPTALVGFGAVFQGRLVRQTWARYFEHFPLDDLTKREADRIFTGLNRDRIVMVDVPKTDREFASAPGRLWTDREAHAAAHKEAIRRVHMILAAERGAH